MSTGELLIEKDGFLCTLTINRRQKKNALNAAVLTGIGDALKSIENDWEVRVVILRGAGEDSFSSGMDLDGSKEEGETGRRKLAMPYARACILNSRCPVIAMVFGYVAGAGCDLAVTCDFRIAADNAKFALNATKLGLVYDSEAIQRFIDLVGVGYAKEIFLTAEYLDATRARDMGLTNFTVPRAELTAFTASFAKGIAGNAPLAIAGTKRVMARLMSSREPSPQVKAEIQAIIDQSWQSEDTQEARRAFAEKRPPVFKGR